METQFAFRLYDKDPEKAAATYEIMKVGLPSGPGKGTQSLSEERGNPGLQSPSLLPSLSPFLDGWGANMDTGEALNGGKELGSILSLSQPFPLVLSVSQT